MLKGYISHWKEREKPEQNRIDYWFTSRPEHAAHWKTREEAQSDSVIFSSHGIQIPSSEGGTYICHDFQVEERAPGEYVVFCVAPFILLASGESTADN